MYQSLRYVVCVVAIFAIVGCQGDTNAPATVKAGGTVTLDGQALADATVTFAPASGKGQAAVGKSDSQGKFKLMTGGKFDGAVAGKYNVSVSKATVEAVAAKTPEQYNEEQKKRMAGGMNSKEARGLPTSTAPKNEVPEKYLDPAKSGLTADVAAGAANDFTFDLKK